MRRMIWMVMIVATVLGMASPSFAAEDTQDLIYLNDGRVLTGQILREEGNVIVFLYQDPIINAETEIRLNTFDVLKVERDQPVESSAEEESEASPEREAPARPAGSAEAGDQALEYAATFGTRRANPDNENATKFYVVPMEGIMGTDINYTIYEEMVEDVLAHDPDYLILVLESVDRPQGDVDWGAFEFLEPEEGQLRLDDYRKLVRIFHADTRLREIPQIMWIHDSVGISSIVAMAWEDMYMKPEAKLSGLAKAAGMFVPLEDDPNIHGKYREAMMGWLKGFVEFGDVDPKVIDAMVRRELMLSASWEGREVKWSFDDSGEVLVDPLDQATVAFNAKAAEDLLISDGTAETIDDLALLMGLREYRIVNGAGKAMFDDHVETWRSLYERAQDEMNNFSKYMGWATGADTLKYLGRAKGSLTRVLNLIRRSEPVSIRLGEQGITEMMLEAQIGRLNEQIRALRQGGRARGGGGRGGGAAGSSGGRR